MTPDRAYDILRAYNWLSLSARVIHTDEGLENTSFADFAEDDDIAAQTAETAVDNVYTAFVRDALLRAIDQIKDERYRRIILLTAQLGVDPDEKNVLDAKGEVRPGLIAKVTGVKQQYVSRYTKVVFKELKKNGELLEIWAEHQ
jgi:hypothetical protein